MYEVGYAVTHEKHHSHHNHKVARDLERWSMYNTKSDMRVNSADGLKTSQSFMGIF